MLKYILLRGLLALAVAFTVSLAAFFLLNIATDPAQAIAGEDATQEVVQTIRARYGLDQPLPVRYGQWLVGVLQGDFGESYYWHKPVAELVAERAGVTITLALAALSVTILIAIPLGALAALNPNTWLDRMALGVAVSAQAVPNFWLGLIMIILFAVMVPIFPVSGDDTWRHFVLPAFVLGASSVPAVMRLTRTGLIEVMSADYIRTARSKGFRGGALLRRHALRNALLPVISVLAVQLGQKFGGSVITESIFAINGLGRLALESILGADIPTVQMLIFVFAIVFVAMNLLADILNAALDPRIRIS
ncbi:ABC transporter permease [Pseudooceanicola sediminis]|uniref:ABC transporter permease n=1 Tax=Pseudooceanicola sediminis TaxID=2211117 RepID=A0A399IYR3_9RHOB|nr:ABC transporter permease [Pseudooceanicola sediminis]KAA2316050.1 ABC transporter permease [Puniceibacterium sp. HSS470]RII38161.1 ABC transporter permease [Pseudooceanicola sediminis]|tara:strand:- start:34338 stop:35255 length:918 start_codon:yes stop_codon:yes gene_type:complete